MMIRVMTIQQGYRQAQAAKCKQPCLDYPYLGIPEEDDMLEEASTLIEKELYL